MAFAAALRFGGLCAHVANNALDKSPTKIWVVMPDAKAPENEAICKHFPAILLKNTAHLAGADSVSTASSGVVGGKFFWGIERKEITFVSVGAVGQVFSTLTIPKGNNETDFRFVPDLARIVPRASYIHPRFQEDAGSKGMVIARVVVDHGRVMTLPRGNNIKVHFPGGDAYETPANAFRFAHDTVVELGRLERLEIHARDLDTDKVETLVLAGSTEPCEVLVGNLCGDIWLWELGGPPPRPDELDARGLVVDYDFEAFYFLSYPKPSTEPMGPLPTWVQGGSTGAKCHIALFSPFMERDAS